jgi:hypothetical protein
MEAGGDHHNPQFKYADTTWMREKVYISSYITRSVKHLVVLILLYGCLCGELTREVIAMHCVTLR